MTQPRASRIESYIGETQLSHATFTAAGCFYRESDATIELSLTPTYGIKGDPMEASRYMAFYLLFFGMIAFNDLMMWARYAL